MKGQRHNKPSLFYHEGKLSFKKVRGKKRIILGLTGSFGSGKTTVAAIFKSYGCKIIDADRIAHTVIKHAGKVYKQIIDTFGCDILKNNKSIDRDKLARIVFNNRSALGALNKIIHPVVIGIIKNQIRTSRAKVIVLDAPLLIEAGLKSLVDKLIVVNIKKNIQIERIVKKMPLSKADILKRIKNQIPLGNKVRLADFVIDNNGTLEETKSQILKIWKKS
jgi:dephospho-CoA kinase